MIPNKEKTDKERERKKEEGTKEEVWEGSMGRKEGIMGRKEERKEGREGRRKTRSGVWWNYRKKGGKREGEKDGGKWEEGMMDKRKHTCYNKK